MSANSTRDDLAPTVLAFATLLPITSRLRAAALRPDRPCWKLMLEDSWCRERAAVKSVWRDADQRIARTLSRVVLPEAPSCSVAPPVPSVTAWTGAAENVVAETLLAPSRAVTRSE